MTIHLQCWFLMRLRKHIRKLSICFCRCWMPVHCMIINMKPISLLVKPWSFSQPMPANPCIRIRQNTTIRMYRKRWFWMLWRKSVIRLPEDRFFRRQSVPDWPQEMFYCLIILRPISFRRLQRESWWSSRRLFIRRLPFCRKMLNHWPQPFSFHWADIVMQEIWLQRPNAFSLQSYLNFIVWQELTEKQWQQAAFRKSDGSWILTGLNRSSGSYIMCRRTILSCFSAVKKRGCRHSRCRKRAGCCMHRIWMKWNRFFRSMNWVLQPLIIFMDVQRKRLIWMREMCIQRAKNAGRFCSSMNRNCRFLSGKQIIINIIVKKYSHFWGKEPRTFYISHFRTGMPVKQRLTSFRCSCGSRRHWIPLHSGIRYWIMKQPSP